MMSIKSSILLGSLALCMPFTALAQEAPAVSIEQVLLDQALNSEYPINSRMASRIAELQQLRAAEARATAYEELLKTSAPPAPEEEIDEPVLEEEPLYEAAPEGEGMEISAAELRLLERYRENAADREVLARYGINLNAQGGPQTLHSGAPLAPTGAGMWILASALSLAAILTMLFAKQNGMKMKFWR